MTTNERAEALHLTIANMPEEQRFAVFKTLHHHKDVTPVMVQLMTGVITETAAGEEPFEIPYPTDEEKKFAEPIVKEWVTLYFDAMNEACVEVTGEPLDEDWTAICNSEI